MSHLRGGRWYFLVCHEERCPFGEEEEDEGGGHSSFVMKKDGLLGRKSSS